MGRELKFPNLRLSDLEETSGRINTMDSSSRKLIAIFDRFLLSGLGCGVIGLCVLMGGFIYVWQNPPSPAPTVTQTSVDNPVISTITPTSPVSGFSTATSFPTLTPTVVGAIPTSQIPSPVPIGNTSPPTGKIVFTCFVNQIDQICLMNADGTGRRQITDFSATSYYASLSPDGKTIYFASRESGTFEIYSINTRGRGLDLLTRNLGTLSAPEVSPDGERIVFANITGGSEQIWTIRYDGKNPHAITTGPDIDPTWSPDGTLIAFASSRSGTRQLYVMEKDGTEMRQVTNLPDMGGRSTWSPDGRRLAFYAGPDGNHNIYVINIDGTGLVQLTNGGDNLGPSWSPDGNWIAFTSFRDGNNEIYIIRPDGAGLTRLTNSPSSDWQPRWGN